MTETDDQVASAVLCGAGALAPVPVGVRCCNAGRRHPTRPCGPAGQLGASRPAQRPSRATARMRRLSVSNCPVHGSDPHGVLRLVANVEATEDVRE
jgi:hypothetical protein